MVPFGGAKLYIDCPIEESRNKELIRPNSEGRRCKSGRDDRCPKSKPGAVILFTFINTRVCSLQLQKWGRLVEKRTWGCLLTAVDLREEGTVHTLYQYPVA